MENKIRIYWMPNFLSGFTYPVINLGFAHYALELLSALDLEGSERILDRLKFDFPDPEFESFGQKLTTRYKEFRRSHSINSSHLIVVNTGNIQVFYDACDEGEDWYEWVKETEDDYFNSLSGYVDSLKENFPTKWQEKLIDDTCDYL